MKSFYYIILCIALVQPCMGQGQRYFDEVFDEVEVQPNRVYGQNMAINFATGGLDTSDLYYDLYTPSGDTETARPLVLVAHTGSFLPPVINGQATGQRLDSTVIEVCKRLARRGFVVAAYTYRLGWRPDATVADVRKGSLLQAAYRGIQDTRTCIRYFREETDINNNPYGIDPNKIACWGIGTGGYLSAGTATLDRHSEVELDKFLDATNTPYIDTTLLGNIYGSTNKPGCIANAPEYSSDISFAFNMGGALGDLEWIQDGNIPPMSGVHCPGDAFAPYYVGNVIVPTTGAIVIDEAAGTRGFMEKVNAVGANDIFNDIEPALDVLKPIMDFYNTVDLNWGPITIKLGTPNMYPFIRPLGEGSPWDWWNKTDLDNLVAYINAQTGQAYDADKIHSDGLLTNQDMSAEKGRRYLDTVFALAAPRLCAAMDLGCIYDGLTEYTKEEVDLTMAPIPARNEITIQTKSEFPIQSVYVYNMNGQLVRADVKLSTTQYKLSRNRLPSGVYLTQINFAEGYITQKVTFQ